jgi:hypothetical protein
MTRFLCILILASLFAARPASAVDMPGWPADGIIKFKAFRNGAPLGYSMVRFEDRGETQLVQVSTVFEVGIGPISAFIYLLRIDTVWKDGDVLTLSSRVNDDGDDYSVEVRPGPDALAYSGAKGQGSVERDILPSTYWRTDLTTRDHILDAQYGGVRRITMTDLGTERVPVKGETVSARRWSMRGQLDLDLWYDDAGEWVRLDFTKGDSHVIYERVAPGPGDAAAFVPLDEVLDAGGSYVRGILQQLDR